MVAILSNSICQINQFGSELKFGHYIYCGKQTIDSDEKLLNCSLGSKVGMKMVHNFLISVSTEMLINYHAVMTIFLRAQTS